MDWDLEDVPLETAKRSFGFVQDVTVVDEAGNTATIGLSQDDGPNYTVKQHMLQLRAMQSHQNSSTHSINLDDLAGLGDSGSIESSLADIAEEPTSPQRDDSDSDPLYNPDPFFAVPVGTFDPFALEEGQDAQQDDDDDDDDDTEEEDGDDSSSLNEEHPAGGEEGNSNRDKLREMAEQYTAYQRTNTAREEQ